MSQPSVEPQHAPARGIPGRIVGIDYARFLALAGMMATHLWTVGDDGGAPLLSAALQGKAASLFAVLAGVGIALSTRGALAAGRPAAAHWSVFGRGLALVVLGLTLGLFPGGILVILVYYGLTFWAMIPFLRVPSRVLVAIAVGWALVWPFLLQAMRSDLVVPFEVGSANWFDLADPLTLVRGLLATGVYPVGTWVVYAMVGMVVGRAVLEASGRAGADASSAGDASQAGDAPAGRRPGAAVRDLGLRIAALGAVLAAAAGFASWLLAVPLGGLRALAAERGEVESVVGQEFYAEHYGGPSADSLWWLASPAPHTGTFFDLAVTCGTALLAIGLCLALGAVLPTAWRRALSPVSGAGAAPLTVYSAHVIVAGFTDAALSTTPWFDGVPWGVSSVQLWLLHVAGALLIGLVLSLVGKRGPLEALVSWVARRFARLGARPDDAQPAARRLDG
ncbi:heparan-alpha-glucosaminide N-acetyltransferase domain-containing protein [Agromyces soli]